MSFGDRAAHDGQRGKATGRRGGRQSTKAFAAVWVNLGLDVEPRQAQQRASHVKCRDDGEGLVQPGDARVRSKSQQEEAGSQAEADGVAQAV